MTPDELPEHKTANFGANLRYLCERHGSISSICRRIKINRQQVNKYLSGLHLPSAQNQRLIANFFGLSVSILYTDPEEFRMLMDGNYFHAMENLRNAPKLAQFMETSLVNERYSGDSLIGIYDRYHYSSVYEGKILRSAHCIYKNNYLLQHYYIERFPGLDSPLRAEFVFKYHGFTTVLSGRIFTYDFETVQKNEMTFGIYAAVQRSSKNFLFGITSGITANMLRPPYSAKVAMHYRGPGMLRREHLDHVTVLDADDKAIPAEVLRFLNGKELSLPY